MTFSFEPFHNVPVGQPLILVGMLFGASSAQPAGGGPEEEKGYSRKELEAPFPASGKAHHHIFFRFEAGSRALFFLSELCDA